MKGKTTKKIAENLSKKFQINRSSEKKWEPKIV